MNDSNIPAHSYSTPVIIPYHHVGEITSTKISQILVSKSINVNI